VAFLATFLATNFSAFFTFDGSGGGTIRSCSGSLPNILFNHPNIGISFGRNIYSGKYYIRRNNKYKKLVFDWSHNG